MLALDSSTRFKKDLKACYRQHKDIGLLKAVVDTLRIPAPLPQKNKDHTLVGNYVHCRECHVQPDWILIYRIDGNTLFLERTGSHSDLFG